MYAPDIPLKIENLDILPRAAKRPRITPAICAKILTLMVTINPFRMSGFCSAVTGQR
jgi:hypothetical protein